VYADYFKRAQRTADHGAYGGIHARRIAALVNTANRWHAAKLPPLTMGDALRSLPEALYGMSLGTAMRRRARRGARDLSDLRQHHLGSGVRAAACPRRIQVQFDPERGDTLTTTSPKTICGPPW